MLDGTVAQGGAQAAALWGLREGVSEALRLAGAVYKYDVSLPQGVMYRCVLLTMWFVCVNLDSLLAGAVCKYVSLPQGRCILIRFLPPPDPPPPAGTRCVEEARERLAGHQGVSVVGYGHMGDGNLHLNVSSPGGYSPELEAAIEPWVYEWTQQVGCACVRVHLSVCPRSFAAASASSTAAEYFR